MYGLEQVVQDVTPRLPTAIAPVRHPMGLERPEVAEREVKGDPDSLQEGPAGPQDETYLFFVRPLGAVGAVGLELIVGQTQQSATDLSIGTVDILTTADAL